MTIHNAAARGDLAEVMRSLMHDPALCLARDISGASALHHAALTGSCSISDVLILRGADVNAVDSHGRTPLHFAAMRGHLPVSEKLIDSGAEADIRDMEGATPLYYAILSKNSRLVEMLVNLGARINERPRASGETLLETAMWQSTREIVDILKLRGGQGFVSAAIDSWDDVETDDDPGDSDGLHLGYSSVK